MAAPGVDPSPWTTHRRRAEVLRGRYPYAAQMLTLYLALVDAWEDGWEILREDRPQPRRVAGWAAERVLPGVVKATEAAGPESLAATARDLLDAGGLEGSLVTWLAGGELEPVERYLADATLRVPLMALGPEADAACADDPSPRGERRCPRCGGPPQLSVRGASDDRLVSGRRQLACARCAHVWPFASSSCPACGESTGAKRTVFSERRAGPVVGRDVGGNADPDAARDVGGGVDRDSAGDPPDDPAEPAPTLPHLRIDACGTCERYLIDVDLGRDIAAVPEVDELAALPLDLYAVEQGLRKITPNLMGF